MPIFGIPPIQEQGGSVASQYWRATASAWTSSNPVLGLNEIGQETDTLKYKVGDGETAWNDLDYNGLQGPPGADGQDGSDGYTPVKGVDYFDGSKGDKGDTGDPGTTTWAGITDKPSVFTPDTHAHSPSEITGTAVVTNDSRLSDARTPTSHSHSPTDVTGTAVITTDSRLSDARTPTAHDQAISTVTGLQTALDGKAASGHTHTGTYEPANANIQSHVTVAHEPANANIQTHVTSAHAPSNAQKNSDIIKAEIEAVLTGAISSHSHPGGANTFAINVQALTSSPGDGATVYFGTLPKAPVSTGGQSKIYARAACAIKRAEIYVYSGTAGTNENWSLYIRVNNSSDTLIATVGANTNERVFSNAALNISLNAGDYFEIKGVQPTWATNPLTTIYGGYVLIQE